MDLETTSEVTNNGVKAKPDLPELGHNYLGEPFVIEPLENGFGDDVGGFGVSEKDNPDLPELSSISEEELKEELQAFLDVFPTIINDVTEDLDELEDVRKWIADEQVGMLAINDKCFIQNSVHYIVKKYFSNCDYYTGILDTFLEVSRELMLGQYHDMQSNLLKKPKLKNFTFKKCETIALRKSSPMLLLTVRLALFLADYDKEVAKHPVIEGILRKIGLWIQQQNDFLDCFGDLAESGKITGEDIENGRCTWLINKAIERASESQLEILEENYGVKDPICTEKVMNVYKELKIVELYLEHEELVYKQILDEVQQLSNNEMLSFFQPLLYNLAKHVYEGKYASV